MPEVMSSENAVSKTTQKSLCENGSKSVAAGIVIGGLANVILSRGGASGTRKSIIGFGTGAGIGSAWTQCSLELESLLKNR